jgi:hypothetical protein
MKHDYTNLDDAILAVVASGGPVAFHSLSCRVAAHSDEYAENDNAPGWRIVDRRLQALRKAGKIRHQHKPEGWVVAA